MFIYELNGIIIDHPWNAWDFITWLSIAVVEDIRLSPWSHKVDVFAMSDSMGISPTQR